MILLSPSSPISSLPFLRRLLSPRMDSSASRRPMDKLLLILGATGCGKSRLSLDLASLFPNSEIINSDKMQLYQGLDITTNKVPLTDRRQVPHHLLADLPSLEEDVAPAKFRSLASRTISDIISRGNLPILVGGSNSFIHALVANRFDPAEQDAFSGSGSVCRELRYDCCFLWVDVALPALFDSLCKRVDDMLESGMFQELAGFYDPEKAGVRAGLRKAIGVPEMELYFSRYPPSENGGVPEEGSDPARSEAFEEAVREIKDNTCRLAKRQIGKILRLKGAGWDLRRVDATGSVRAAENGEQWKEIWESEVVEPSAKIVKRFLSE